tara:strand:+ start:768 stop:1349 length:582 start_codon:yes stop_codon:yes gene_type:complete
MNDKTLYRIINLDSGDNLIAQVTETREKVITVYRPFQMKVITLLDEEGPMSMQFRKEALIFRNWLEFSTDQKVIIPRNKVIAMTLPNEMLSNLYEQEKEKEDNPKFMQDLIDKMKKLDFEEELEDVLDEVEEEFSLDSDEMDSIAEISVEIDPDDIRDIVHRIIEDAKNPAPQESDDKPDESSIDEDEDMFGW